MKNKIIVWMILAVATAAVIALLLRARRLLPTVTIQGAVIESNGDTRKELPIADVAISALDGARTYTARSDAAGYFKLVLQNRALSGKPIVLSLRRPDYEPLDVEVQIGRLHTHSPLYVERMVPISPRAAGPHRPDAVVSEVRVRYTINSRSEINIGSAVKTFQVVNEPNVPCNGHPPCSPDKRWKASSASASLDAGADNVFNNVRASCIAGPCPFTRVSSSEAFQGVRKIQISALNWSETATFLVEAEVIHTQISSNVRELYPVIFGRGLNFTLPPTAEGVSLEAEIDGSPIVFPLDPNLKMSWANCALRTGDKDNIAVYRCSLNPGYRF